MKKQELIHLHGLLYEIREDLNSSDEGFSVEESDYEELGTRPTTLHASINDHERAVLVLGKELAEKYGDFESSIEMGEEVGYIQVFEEEGLEVYRNRSRSGMTKQLMIKMDGDSTEMRNNSSSKQDEYLRRISEGEPLEQVEDDLYSSGAKNDMVKNGFFEKYTDEEGRLEEEKRGLLTSMVDEVLEPEEA